MALYKKQEALCIELGLRSSLGYCYWNWGPLARKLKDKNTELEKLQAALKIFTELNMSRQRKAVQAELNKSTAGQKQKRRFFNFKLWKTS